MPSLTTCDIDLTILVSIAILQCLRVHCIGKDNSVRISSKTNLYLTMLNLKFSGYSIVVKN